MPEYRHPAVRAMIFLITILGIGMLYTYFSGYNLSIGWSLSTESSFEEIIAYQFQKGPFAFRLMGEKVTLAESFIGDPIKNLVGLRVVSFSLVLLGIVVLTACATYFRQLGFLIYSALLILFLIQLRLEEFLSAERWVAMIPAMLLIGPAYYFQAYQTNSTFLLRFGGIALGAVVGVVFIPGSLADFSLHFYAHGLLPLMILIFLFLCIISEELVFLLLYFLTRNKGSQSNHVHMIIMGGIYVANLIGYYLNKARLFDISFTFMDPFILLIISTGVAIWSLRHKVGLLGNLHFVPAFLIFLSLGIISFSILGWSFAQGLDGVYEGVHYLVIYTHLGFGFFFLAYIIINFIDPLSKGLQIYKVAFKPQSFHYATARLAGLAAISAFFFLSSKAALNLFQSANYSLKGDQELLAGNTDLATTYYQNAEFYGYNSHYPNYQLGNLFLSQEKLKLARRHFEKAAKRHPSAQAHLNSSNLQSSSDLSLAKVALETGLANFPGQPELKNNLGIINLKNGLLEQSYAAFSGAESNQDWNDALKANRWGAMAALRDLKGEDPSEDFISDNLVVQTNVLSAMLSSGVRAELIPNHEALTSSPFPLHQQAFTLNGLFFFTDTVTQRIAKQVLDGTDIGISNQLRKAIATNLYVSGKVRSAFLMLDQMQIGKSGTQQAEIFNEMGLLALDQNAPREARDFFTQAMERGYEPARFNRFVAFLEAGDFGNAQLQLLELIQRDTSYRSFERTLEGVFNPGSSSTAEARFNELYFGIGNGVNPTKVVIDMKEFGESSQQLLLDRIVVVSENKELDLNAFKGLSIQLPDLSALDSATLVSQAMEQPFDERLVIEAAELLNETESIDAYNLLDQSLEFNPYSVPLLKAKAMAAIDINLPEYADQTLATLSNLLTLEEYSEFIKSWYEKQDEVQSDWSFN